MGADRSLEPDAQAALSFPEQASRAPATNHGELLDWAVFRRFDELGPFDTPNREQLSDLLKLRLAAGRLREEDAERLVTSAKGWSFAEVVRSCDDAVRTMAIDNREEVSERDCYA